MPRNKLVVSQVHRQVRLALTENSLQGKLLVVAVSGGPDSLALLYALHHLQDELGISLHGAHLNHSLRANASDADSDFVTHTFEKLGIPYTIEKADVECFRQAHRMSIEEAAREVRYAFLAKVAREHKAEALALGHTSDDQAETVLMHIIRGSGLTGLKGMEAYSKRNIGGSELAMARPLIDVSRQGTTEYCKAQDLTPRRDESNQSMEYRRNRIRLELLPLLEEYNPAIREALIRLSHTASQDVTYLEEQVAGIWPQIVQESSGSIQINREAFGELPLAIQASLLRRAVLAVKGNLNELEQSHIQDMARLMTGPAGRSLNLPGSLRFTVGYTDATIGNANLDACPLPLLEGKHKLNIPGQTVLDGWTITAKIVDSEKAEPKPDAQELIALLGYEGIGDELHVRSRIPGDRFQPLGMTHSKKLQDFMVDEKIPRSWRDRVPLVVSPKGIAWVVGWRIAEWARAEADNSAKLQIQFTPR